MNTKLLLLLSASVLMTACTNANISRDLSSGAIGCQPNDITITNETATANSIHNWTAECSGKEYVCSYHPSSGTNCTALIKE